jgi:hypothetical protein
MPHVDANEMAVHLAAFPPAHILLARGGGSAATARAAASERAPAPMSAAQIAAAFGGRVVSGGRRGR